MIRSLDAARSDRAFYGNGNGNGQSRLTQHLLVLKRNGEQAAYKKTKIVDAVLRCFLNSCGFPDNEPTRQAAEAVASAVDNLLILKPSPVSVEQIQDLVEQQLMALGHHVAAKEYILYREKHRQLRESRPVDEATQEAFSTLSNYFTGVNRQLQIAQCIDKFSRFNAELGRREAWPEVGDRVMGFIQEHLVEQQRYDQLPRELWPELRRSLLQLETSPSMRVVQMAGPALQRCQTGVYNCSYLEADGPVALSEDLYLLMQGCGVGFSVEGDVVDNWPRVRKQKGEKAKRYDIPDTTEGWCYALRLGVETWLAGEDIEFNFDAIRKKGTPLRTKGGRASGPGPLKDLLTFARTMLLKRQGRRLSTTDVHRLFCFSHRIVRMGGVRRSSGISLSDLNDQAMRTIKTGQFWGQPDEFGFPQDYLNQANNSAVYLERPDSVQFMEEWLALAKSGSGERGICNRGGLRHQLPKRRIEILSKKQLSRIGVNPCGEIFLQPNQFCNLSIAVMRPGLTWEQIRERVRLAAIWGTIQSTMTRFRFIRDEWRQNAEMERLLGVDLLGHLDHPLLQPKANGLDLRLAELRDLAVATNAEWAGKLGINASTAVTCGKPSGDSSVLYDCAAGFKPWHGQYYIRRFRTSDENPVARVLQESGVPWEKDYDGSGLVFDFPCRAPENAIVLGDKGYGAIEQLEHWLSFKRNYTEHNPSVTIYIKPEEWLAAGHWVYEHFDEVGGLSFSPDDGGSYRLMPYEAISEERYQELAAKMPTEIDWWKITRYEEEDMTEARNTAACAGGACLM